MWKKIKENLSRSAEIKIAHKLLEEINALSSKYSQMPDSELQNMTNVFKEQLQNKKTLEQIRVEVFAAIREATFRVLKKRPYDVQILGGLILDMGSIAEMKTGEGKTLTSIAPVYLNALEGNGVIVSTVNEYLSERDAEEVGQVHRWMGLTVGVNKTQMDSESKRFAYACDITYSVHSELGFDYLRDNMVTDKESKVQRGLNYILIDEVDSILIDEAKTPLIISGGQKNNSNLYVAADLFVRTLTNDDFFIDHEMQAIKLTDSGIDKANSYFKLRNLYEIKNSELVHRIQNSLRAHKIMKKDVEYIVRDEKIELVDTFTGRVMEGRAYSEGLQQAIQTKENLEIEPETKTLATITYQNLFRMFKKLAGMTGTAKTEEQEFIDIYNTRVNVIDTNKPIIRKDDKDLIFASMQAKFDAIVEEIKRVYKIGQPILIGTSQIDESEHLHEMLKKENIPHTVLNAKQNESEAEIIAKAGQEYAVTIATNMAGRGTDIKPSPEALEKGGLYVLGINKAESRRIDNQLKGRSGRQGDVGYTKFYLSIEDLLMTRFSNFEMIKESFNSDSKEPIRGKSIYRFFDRAQKKIEGFNYDNRKNVLSYDDVIRQQRDLVYTQRDLILNSDNLDIFIKRVIKRSVRNILSLDFIALANNEVNYSVLEEFLNNNFSYISKVTFSKKEMLKFHREELIEYLYDKLCDIYFNNLRINLINNLGEEYYVSDERRIMLTALDNKWQDHIDVVDRLRSSSNLVQYSQKNPYQIFTEETTKKFEVFINDSSDRALYDLFNNRNAMKIVYIEHTLSNGEVFVYQEDWPREMVQQMIEQKEFEIIQQKKASEKIPYILENGKIIFLDKNLTQEQIQEILLNENKKILESNNN
ncbi:preprotein translocase subunit SecA [Mesomycoplasma neurolyticum]|uniref:Protein translocase subunit SecA n=1 Tax=Mesomycoplasma neurolyticum TaxID=2120 RepID=A0A449A6D1_9BACT|nr:preprotein translocase subunit SecA [Mesomycoplasma neurolyticum]VEU59782.1 preprotein translocase subunit SecA [Mesomycoplasma neurolyticum]